MDDTTTAKKAAAQAGVTVSTIRTWCRMGAVAATKTGGRWNIDTASLAHRIALTAKPKAPRTLDADAMVEIGGSRWAKNGHDRVYLNDWARFAGLEIQRYNTGNIQWAAWQGEGIANRQAGMILGSIDKVWYDAADGLLHARFGSSTSNVADHDEIWNATVAGIRAAVTAL